MALAQNGHTKKRLSTRILWEAEHIYEGRGRAKRSGGTRDRKNLRDQQGPGFRLGRQRGEERMREQHKSQTCGTGRRDVRHQLEGSGRGKLPGGRRTALEEEVGSG